MHDGVSDYTIPTDRPCAKERGICGMVGYCKAGKCGIRLPMHRDAEPEDRASGMVIRRRCCQANKEAIKTENKDQQYHKMRGNKVIGNSDRRIL